MLLHTQPHIPSRHARLQWRHEHIEPLATGPAAPELGSERLADYLVVTNTGTCEATTLTFAAVPVASTGFHLHGWVEPLDLPAGASASWALVHTPGPRRPESMLSVAAQWFEDDDQRAGGWDVVVRAW